MPLTQREQREMCRRLAATDDEHALITQNRRERDAASVQASQPCRQL